VPDELGRAALHPRAEPGVPRPPHPSRRVADPLADVRLRRRGRGGMRGATVTPVEPTPNASAGSLALSAAQLQEVAACSMGSERIREGVGRGVPVTARWPSGRAHLHFVFSFCVACVGVSRCLELMALGAAALDLYGARDDRNVSEHRGLSWDPPVK
jgi:hypothetical protein